MRKMLLMTLFVATLQAQGQTVKEWMQLPPIPVQKPVFGDTRDVDGQTFNDAKLLRMTTHPVETFRPEVGRAESSGLVWSKVSADGEGAVAVQADRSPAVVYSATYAEAPEWVSGNLVFSFDKAAEVCVDGEQKLTNCKADGTIEEQMTLPVRWEPGKHTVIVKSLAAENGSNPLFSAEFVADEPFREVPVRFTLSPKRGKNILDVLNGTRVTGAHLSPSGAYILLGVSETVKGKTTAETRLLNLATKEILYTLSGDNTSDIAWLPGEDTFSFVREEAGGRHFYAYSVAGRRLERLFPVAEGAEGFRWSPDKSYLLYYVSEDHNDKDWELRDVQGMEDRQPAYRKRLYLCKHDMATHTDSRLTWGSLSTFLQDISPDGRQVIFSTTRPDYGKFPFMEQCVYLLDMAANTVDTLWNGPGEGTAFSFSPDGRKLLVRGAANIFGSVGLNIGKHKYPNSFDLQLFLYDLQSREATPLTRDFDPSVIRAEWHKDGNIYFTANDTDYIRLFRLTPDGAITRMECPGAVVTQFTLSEQAPQAVYAANDENYPPRLYTLSLADGAAAEWWDPQGGQYRDVEFGEVKDWDYRYDKNTLVDGRYYLPADFDPSQKYPMIVYYYGGCTPVERTFGGRWPFNLYAANGYVVYVLQPSGAIGFGQEFSARHQHNWGRVTADEIIASVKAFLKAHPFVDPQRVGCMGASYGGFTTMYLQTRTDIFACAISHAGISDITGYWGGGYWGYSYSTEAAAEAYPWNRRDIYVDQSPLYNADKVTTPMLLLHGTADTNVPTNESVQFYTALKLLGRDVHLVLVKDADHAVAAYDQRILWGNTIMAYFAKYLKGQPAWWNHLYPEKNL